MRVKLAILALLAVSASAQHREEVTVEVVDVPVYVHRAGAAVENLRREDFELFVNGERRPVEYFDIADLAAPPPTPTVPDAAPAAIPAIRQRRLFLFVFDLVFSRPVAIGRGQRAAVQLVNDAPAADAYAVATLTATRGLQFVLPFTSDRAAAIRAIAELRPTSADDPLRLRITENEREAISGFMTPPAEDSGGGRGNRADGIMTSPVTGGGEAMDDARKQPIRRLVEQQVSELGSVAGRVAQLDGYKHIVVLSEGFNPYLVHDVRRDLGSRPPQANSALIGAIHDMYERLQAADTFLHTLDTSGLRHTFDPLVNEALNMLSTGTGGRFLHNTNDLAGALTTLSTTHRQAYLLGFVAKNVRAGHNKIEVKVKNVPRGTQVSYRRGFSGTPAPRGLDGLRLADIILNDLPQTGPAATLEARDGVISIHAPANGLVMLYIFNEQGATLDSRHARIAANQTIDAKLPLPPGRYVAKALLRTDDALGFTRIHFEIK